MERKLRKRATMNLMITTVVMALYFASIIAFNYFYAKGLGEVMIVRYEVLISIFGAAFIISEGLCLSKLLKLYEKIAFMDPLTGCKTRESLDSYFDDIERKRNVNNITYFLFDLNHLKEINEVCGRIMGDEYLKAIARSLMNVFGDEQVFRLGGGEFASIYTGDIHPYVIIDKIYHEIDRSNVNLEKTYIPLSITKAFYRGPYNYEDKYYRDTLYKKALAAIQEDETDFKRILPRPNKRGDDDEKAVNMRKL